MRVSSPLNIEGGKTNLHVRYPIMDLRIVKWMLRSRAELNQAPCDGLAPVIVNFVFRAYKLD